MGHFLIKIHLHKMTNLIVFTLFLKQTCNQFSFKYKIHNLNHEFNMLQEIKNLIYSKYKAEDKIWLFFSIFDENWALIDSTWVVSTDKTLEESINLLYEGKIKQHENRVKHVIIDIVKEILPQTDINAFLQMDPKINWVILSETAWEKTWVILPNMKWITSMKQAIAWIKSKYQLQWDVTISTFTVNELTLDK